MQGDAAISVRANGWRAGAYVRETTNTMSVEQLIAGLAQPPFACPSASDLTPSQGHALIAITVMAIVASAGAVGFLALVAPTLGLSLPSGPDNSPRGRSL